MWFIQNAMAKPDNAGAGSTDYMHLFGLVALGFMWAKMAKAANEKLKDGADGRAEFLSDAADARTLLHGAHDAGNGDAPSAHLHGRRCDDGAHGGGVLSERT